MTPQKKIIIGVLFTLSVVFLAGILFIYYLITKSLPETEGELKTSLINEEIKVYRNNFDIPYIVANNDHDLMFAFGYSVAQDRLWQMDLQRRLGQGRLSEVFGEKTLALDVLARTIGFERIARYIEPGLNSDSKNVLKSYSEGINYFIRTHRNKLPIEFDLLKYQPEEWNELHSLIIIRLFGWTMNFSWWTDLVFGEILEKFGEKKASEIFPAYEKNGITIIKNEPKLISSTLENLISSHNIAKNFFGQSILAGSNSWVVSGDKSINGFPMHANDPHLALTLPSEWYIASLHSNNYDVSGVTIPGIPAIIIGNNSNISWGLTNGMVDECDFYMETIDSSGKNQYLYDNAWYNLTTIKETIQIKNNDPFNFTVFQTKNGPVVSQFKNVKGFYQFKEQNIQLNQDATITGQQISLRWTGFEISDEINGIIQINKARNKVEFENGVNQIKVPGLNITYCDVNNIGYWLAAKIPVRKYQNSFLPVSGSSSKFAWERFVPSSELPHLWNPPEKYIATANNKILNNYPYSISYLWESPSRAERIDELLKAKEKFSLEDFQIMQKDVLSPNAREITPILLTVLSKFQNKDLFYEQAITYLRNWDYSISLGSIPGAIYNVFFIKMLKNIFLDKMGRDLFEKYCYLSFLPTNVLTKLIQENKSEWFDNPNTTDKIETRDDIIYQSFLESIDFFKVKFGPEPKNWRWDGLHSLTLRHPFGSVKPLDQIFNVGPFETPGSNTTINCGYYDFNNPFEHVVGPSMRYIYDMSNSSESLMIISSGQSGQPFSSHYQDQISLLLTGKYLPIYNSINRVKGLNYKLLTIKRE